MGKGNSALYAALLGIVIGALLATIVFVRYNKDRRIDVDYSKWGKLNLILGEIEKNYVDTIDMKAMTDAAVEAALHELDPHSVYLPPIELEESEASLAGNFEGIGIQFNVPADTAVVLNVIPGGPSEKAGLTIGDRILKVDDKDIAGVNMPQDSMVTLMKGPSGTKVKILVRRGDDDIPFDIVRDKVPVNSIDASFMLNEDTGYIRLTKFSRTTYTEFTKAFEKLSEAGMTKLLFDLRDNSGGYLDQALLLCNEFLDKGDMIVYMNGLHRDVQEYRADGKGKLRDVELSVLMNESSASSSEIFAGAMQDNDRGVIVGRRSYGKGLVQEPINFTDGSGVRLTVARYYTPSGRCIQKPYSNDYANDIIERYKHGEMMDADSMKVDKSVEFYTVGGRKVYGGGGIIPDVFVPVDTTAATNFFLQCNRKTVQMRFATHIFDNNKERLAAIDNFPDLEKFIESLGLERQFLAYAAKEGIVPEKGEWDDTKAYMMPQVKALVARYSKLSEDAFYWYYIAIDKAIPAALASPFTVDLLEVE